MMDKEFWKWFFIQPITVPVPLVYASFGVAIGVGVLIGWAIWGSQTL